MENKKMSELADEAKSNLVLALIIGSIIGAIGVLGYPFSVCRCAGAVVFIGLLMSMASLTSGFFIGILFGIPKRNSKLGSSYTLNNNLVEVSDWLTKIIAGLGLVNLTKIPGYLNGLGKFVNDQVKTDDMDLSVYTICIVIYFSVFGFYNGYNYMRLVLSLKYKSADDEMDTLIEKLNDKVKENSELKVEIQDKEIKNSDLTTQADHLVSLMNIDPALRNDNSKISFDSVDNDQALNTMKAKAELKFREGMVKNKSIDDPQKGMWGGLAENNDRKVSARIDYIFKGLYKMNLLIESTNPSNPLIDGQQVLLAYHDTFIPPIQWETVKDSKIEISKYIRGSFTLGVMMDNGNTELELDLAELPGVDETFKTT